LGNLLEPLSERQRDVFQHLWSNAKDDAARNLVEILILKVLGGCSGHDDDVV